MIFHVVKKYFLARFFNFDISILYQLIMNSQIDLRVYVVELFTIITNFRVLVLWRCELSGSCFPAT